MDTRCLIDKRIMFKCPECGRVGKIDEFETDNLDCDDNLFDEDYIHVCPACVYHFDKSEIKRRAANDSMDILF